MPVLSIVEGLFQPDIYCTDVLGCEKMQLQRRTGHFIPSVTFFLWQVIGRNKTTQARPERAEGRNAWWRFRLVVHLCAGNACSRLRSKRLIPAYRTTIFMMTSFFDMT